eukprot:697307-Amphidinium_carterae.1
MKGLGKNKNHMMSFLSLSPRHITQVWCLVDIPEEARTVCKCSGAEPEDPRYRSFDFAQVPSKGFQPCGSHLR